MADRPGLTQQACHVYKQHYEEANHANRRAPGINLTTLKIVNTGQFGRRMGLRHDDGTQQTPRSHLLSVDALGIDFRLPEGVVTKPKLQGAAGDAV
jgi:hypothetical protein